LTVVDDRGLRDTRTATVTVTGTSGNQAPAVEAGIGGVVGLSNSFNLHGWVGDDGQPNPPAACTIAWSQVSGPGRVTFGNVAATNTTARFSTNGTYVLQLSANDGEVSGSDTVTITVFPQEPYRSPCEVAYAPDGAQLAVADRTAQSVVIMDPATGAVVRTIPVAGEPRDLVWHGTNRLFVSENSAGTVAELDSRTGETLRRLPVGPKPSGLALVPGKQLLVVADRGLNQVSLVDLAAGQTRREVSVAREPVYVAVTPDETLALVVNHLPHGDARNPDHAASISLVHLDSMAEVDHVKLPPGATAVQRLVCAPDGRWAYVLHLLGRAFLPTTQLSRGWVITSAMSIIDLQSKQVYATVLFDQTVDGAADPWGLAVSPDGRTLWASFAGVHEGGRLDLAGLHALLASNATLRASLHYDLTTLYNSNLLQRIPVPAVGPRGITLAPGGLQLAVAAYFSGQVLLLDTNAQVTAAVALGSQPAADAVRRGEQLYFDASGCYQRWLSCNSCHPGARADGLNWDLMNDGFGNPKNTKSMLYATQTEPAMWTGIRANAMVGVQAGFKFIEFQAHPQQDYDDIHTYLSALQPESSPYWVNGRLTPDAVQGKAIFESAQARCLECHRPDYFYAHTNKYDVGTRHEADWTANDLTGYVPPPLEELWRTGPYLHDGSAVTMRDVLTTFNEEDRHGVTSHLNANQIDQLAAYLLQIGGALPVGLTNPYSLEVVGGTGSGSYLPGSTVAISATVLLGSQFLTWLGDAVLHPQTPATSLLMPEQDLTVAALIDSPPTISSIPDQVLVVGASLPPIAFTVGDSLTPASNLVVSAASSNPGLLPDPNLGLSGSGLTRWLTLEPVAGEVGQATVTVTVTDGTFAVSEAFSLNVVQPVALSLTRSGGNLSLTWPAEAGAFTLYSSETIGPLAVWTPVSTAPVLVDGEWQVLLPVPLQGNRFYRLSAE
jgi:YVTN family beta-propeller protein